MPSGNPRRRRDEKLKRIYLENKVRALDIDGKSHREIADDTGLSKSTVDKLLSSAGERDYMQEKQFNSRSEMVLAILGLRLVLNDPRFMRGLESALGTAVRSAPDASVDLKKPHSFHVSVSQDEWWWVNVIPQLAYYFQASQHGITEFETVTIPVQSHDRASFDS